MGAIKPMEPRFLRSDYTHPKGDDGKYIPLKYGENFNRDLADWNSRYARWYKELPIIAKAFTKCRPRPDLKDYTPIFTREETDVLVMYSDGVPITRQTRNSEELAMELFENLWNLKPWQVKSGVGSLLATTRDINRYLRGRKCARPEHFRRGAGAGVWDPGETHVDPLLTEIESLGKEVLGDMASQMLDPFKPLRTWRNLWGLL